jgi:hypothetical protein
MKGWLMEAKAKVKELKKIDAEKKKVMEGPLSGGERPCTECGGTGMVYEEPKQVPDHVKGKVEKYKRLVNATKAAHKRMDANHNGIPDSEEDEGVEEGFGDTGPKEMKTGDTKKTRTGELTKTATGVVHKNTSYADDGEAEDKSGKGKKSHAKAKDAETKKAERGNDIKLPKHSGNTWGMKNGEKFGKKMEESTKEAAKPSAGLSKEKKSAVVKKAKAGKDIGKPGKSFDKVAKSAGGGEKGKKIAAAAMWKNIKETTAYLEEKKAAEKKADKDYDGDGKVESGKDEYLGSKIAAAKKAGKLKECGPDCTCPKCKSVNESADVSRLRELTGRLNRAETPALVENREVDQIRALTKRLLG